MIDTYVLGMFFAIMSGVMNAVGAILQKSVVNKVSLEYSNMGFIGRLLRNRNWIMGFVVSMGFGTIFNLSAQKLIGPALVPGLAASGIIVLAIGSVKLINEKLNTSEFAGIGLLVAGIFFLGYSNLQILSDTVDLLQDNLLDRIILFSVGLGLIWFCFQLVALKTTNLHRGLTLAFSTGFLYSLSNLWILPMILTFNLVFSGTARIIQIAIFICSCLILVSTNLAGIRRTQEAYLYAPASKVQPILQIPTQIVPIIIYFMVYRRVATGIELLYMSLGVLMIITSGFLLGKRKDD